jgi:hypothetical protein
MSEETRIPIVYTLTDMTGQRKNRDRGVMYLGAEVNVYHRNMMLLGSPFIAIALAVTAPFIGYYSVLVAILVALIWYRLVVRRDSDGLGTTAWTARRDRRKSHNGEHLQSGLILSPALRAPFKVIPSSVRVNPEPSADAAYTAATTAWEAAPSTSRRGRPAPTPHLDAWADEAPATPDDQETW